MATKEDSTLGFTPWLVEYLNSLGLDGDVYGEYIASTLNSLESNDEAELMETVRDLVYLSDDADNEAVHKTIVVKWRERGPSLTATSEKGSKSSEKIDTYFRNAISKSSTRSGKDKGSSQSSARIPQLNSKEKQLMLQQYGCTSDDSDDEDQHTEAEGKGADSGPCVTVNANKESVLEEQKQRKEEMKAAHQSRVERDRKAREAQRQKQLDRKEKERLRTQKAEKRRK